MITNAFFICGDDLFLVDQQKKDLLDKLYKQQQAEIIRFSCHGSESIIEDLEMQLTADLFSPNKIIVITAAEGKWHTHTAKRIVELLESKQAYNHLTLIICLCQFKKQQLKTKVLQTIQKYCKSNIISELSGKALENWILKQATNYNITIDQDAISLIVEKTFAHLYACDQLLQKCHLLNIKNLDQQTVLSMLINNSKYSIYDFISALCMGKSNAIDILNYLKQQKQPVVLILWNLINVLRLSYTASYQKQYSNMPINFITKNIWGQQKNDVTHLINKMPLKSISQYLQQAFEIDKIIKSKGEATTWQQLNHLILAMTHGENACLN